MSVSSMIEAEDSQEARNAVIRSHRCLHSWFTPTHLVLDSTSDSRLGEPSASWHWQSRRSRKARYSPVAHTFETRHPSKPLQAGDHVNEDVTRSGKTIVDLRVQTEKRVKPHLILDVTFWLAVTFTLGSALWVVNGFMVWFPILMPQLDSTAFTNTAAATAFVGGTVFELGSYLMVVEALNHGQDMPAGTTLGQLIHHHRLGEAKAEALGAQNTTKQNPDLQQRKAGKHTTPVERSSPGAQIWWGKPLWHDIGYVAAIIQLIAATVFWVSTLTGLPGVIEGLYGDGGSVPIIDVFFWSPQVVGGIGFILSSFLLMLETQNKWYRPNLTDLGWYIGAWNLVGSIGFTLCGALGYASDASEGATYQSALSTWWGGWAFLFGSVLQLGEAVWREKPDVSGRSDRSA